MFKAQFEQDKTILHLLGEKEDGFFVELGAGNGVSLSNSYYFEKVLGWKGLLIEPNPTFYASLVENRNCFISNKLCGEVEGKEVEFVLAGEVSGVISDFTGYWVKQNINNEKIKLTTTLLSNILEEFNCPSDMDFLSLDVEGQEFFILKTFPFDRFSFRVICVEHNSYCDGIENRMNIRKILLDNGYSLAIEQTLDDFYVRG